MPKIQSPLKDNETQDFSMKLNDPKGRKYNLTIKLNITSKEQAHIIFNLLMSEFQNIDMNVIGHEYGMFDLKNRDFTARKGEGIRAQHFITATSKGQLFRLYTAEIMHIVALQWSSIKISFGSRLMATSHLIGLIHLPHYQQLRNVANICALDPKFEKAMLVKNLFGDFAIVLGKWMGLKKGMC